MSIEIKKRPFVFGDLDAIREILVQKDVFYLAGHVGPDGDSIGSCYALGLALEKMGKKVRVLLAPYHPKYNIIPGRHLLYEGEEIVDSAFVCMDCADVSRLPGFARQLVEGPFPDGEIPVTVSIDHHYTNTGFAWFNYVDSAASSTCELIFRLLDTFIPIDFRIASALYAGLISDTGGFRFNATSPYTLHVAGELISYGINFTEIYTELVHLRTYTELKLLGVF